ncbi:GntR family transcriptional regulator [Nocardioides salsibiostraticola]
MNISVDTASSIPPYEQLRAQIASLVTSGTLPAGTRLAPVRQMAADLGLAPNTVARAYRELEADSVIETHGRRGTFVRSSRPSTPELHALVAEYVANARALGLTCPEAVTLVENHWTS